MEKNKKEKCVHTYVYTFELIIDDILLSFVTAIFNHWNNKRNICVFLNYFIYVYLYATNAFIRIYFGYTKWMLDETTKAFVQTVTRWTPANFKRNAHYCSVTNSY